MFSRKPLERYGKSRAAQPFPFVALAPLITAVCLRLPAPGPETHHAAARMTAAPRPLAGGGAASCMAVQAAQTDDKADAPCRAAAQEPADRPGSAGYEEAAGTVPVCKAALMPEYLGGGAVIKAAAPYSALRTAYRLAVCRGRRRPDGFGMPPTGIQPVMAVYTPGNTSHAGHSPSVYRTYAACIGTGGAGTNAPDLRKKEAAA